MRTLTMPACLARATCSRSVALTSSTAVAAIALALGGAGWVTAWSGVGMRRAAGEPTLGRRAHHFDLLCIEDGAIAAGRWVWGTVAQNHSLAWALEGSAGALLLVAATGVLFPLREPHESEPDPFEQFDTPAVALKLKKKRTYHIQR
ncbi:MFS transporter [Mesorhizobium sp.]|uniref:MFS transporter n=1 Tax=Mesorhizobium sp. TaxID=1871066 RepID=UPI00338E2FB6